MRSHPRFLQLLVFLRLTIAVAHHQPCEPRYVGPPSDNLLYCVCNGTYCDDFPSARVDMQPGEADIIETSLTGKRGEISQAVFTKQDTDANRYAITINASELFQPILGFGGAMTDCAAINAMKLSMETRNQLMNAYFGEEAETGTAGIMLGLGYNLVRVPIGACDFSARQYSYEETPEDWDMTTFNLTDEDYLMKIPLLQQAMNIRDGALKLFAAPWSSPGWMKTNQNVYGPGFMLDGDRYRLAYAKYFIKFFEFYQRYNLTFWGVTPQNEPTLSDDPNYRQIALYWNASTEAEFVGRFLGPALADNSITKNLKIMTLDFNREWLPAFADVYFDNPEASKYTAGVAVHWYSDWQYDASPMNLDLTLQNHPDKFLLYTEACTGDYSLGSWDNAAKYAHDIIENLNHHVQGWVDWNLNVDTGGGPNFIGNFNGAPMIVNTTSDEFYKQPHYYVMGHFSKFVLPDSQRIRMTIERPLNMDGVAFKQSGGRRVLVLHNYHFSDPMPYAIRDIEMPGWELKYDVPANTVATIVYQPGNLDDIGTTVAKTSTTPMTTTLTTKTALRHYENSSYISILLVLSALYLFH